MKKLLLLLCLVVGCHRIDGGVVIKKVVHPPYTMLQAVPCGKFAQCLVPMHYPERYVVNVQGKDSNGASVVEEFDVDKETFYRLKIGDTFKDKE